MKDLFKKIKCWVFIKLCYFSFIKKFIMSKNIEMAAKRSLLAYAKFQVHLSKLLNEISANIKAGSIAGVTHIETKEKGVNFSIMDQAFWIKYEQIADIRPSQNSAFLRLYVVESQKTDNNDEVLSTPLEELDIRIDELGTIISNKPKGVFGIDQYQTYSLSYINTVIAYIFGS